MPAKTFLQVYDEQQLVQSHVPWQGDLWMVIISLVWWFSLLTMSFSFPWEGANARRRLSVGWTSSTGAPYPCCYKVCPGSTNSWGWQSMPIMVVVVFLVSLTQIYGSKAQGINWEYPSAGGSPQSQNFMSIYQVMLSWHAKWPFGRNSQITPFFTEGSPYDKQSGFKGILPWPPPSIHLPPFHPI